MDEQYGPAKEERGHEYAREYERIRQILNTVTPEQARHLSSATARHAVCFAIPSTHRLQQLRLHLLVRALQVQF